MWRAIQPGIAQCANISDLQKWADASLDRDALRHLQSRLERLDLVEQLESGGLTYVTEFDPAWPPRWTERLQVRRPPWVVVAGNPAALALPSTGLLCDGVAPDAASVCDPQIGHRQLEGGQTVLWFTVDPLIRLLQRRTVQAGLETGRLTLISRFAPDAGFHPSHPVNRLKLLLAHVHTAIVPPDLMSQVHECLPPRHPPQLKAGLPSGRSNA